MNQSMESGSNYTFSGLSNHKTNAAQFESMYRNYKTSGAIQNNLELTEAEGIMASSNYRSLSGIFFDNGYFLLKDGEIKRYKDEEGKKYFEIRGFEEIVDKDDFYSYFYPYLCNKIYEIVIKGETIKIVAEEFFKNGIEGFMEKSQKINSQRVAKQIVRLVDLKDEEFIVEQREIFMESLNVGDKFVARVKVVNEKFAILTLTGNENISLFLHVSKMRNAFIKDATLYLYVGQEFEVKVAQIESNKIQVSTIGYPLCKEDRDYYNETGEWMPIYSLEKAIKKERASKLSPLVMQKALLNKTEEREQGEMNQDIALKEVSVSMASTPVEEVANFISLKTGTLSKEALEKLEMMISKFGLFKMGIGVEKLLKDFEIDNGLNLMNETEKLLKK